MQKPVYPDWEIQGCAISAHKDKVFQAKSNARGHGGEGPALQFFFCFCLFVVIVCLFCFEVFETGLAMKPRLAWNT